MRGTAAHIVFHVKRVVYQQTPGSLGVQKVMIVTSKHLTKGDSLRSMWRQKETLNFTLDCSPSLRPTPNPKTNIITP